MGHAWESDSMDDREKHCCDCRFFDTPNDALPCFYCSRTVKNKWEPKDSEFTPEYFSGLNWRDAEKLVGKVVEVSDTGEGDWRGPSKLRSIGPYRTPLGCYEYIRTTPETFQHPTITIGGVELPRPETNALEEGTNYFCFDPAYTGRLTRHVWKGLYIDHLRLNNGCIHLTEDRAQAWASWWQNIVMSAVKRNKK